MTWQLVMGEDGTSDLGSSVSFLAWDGEQLALVHTQARFKVGDDHGMAAQGTL